MNIMNIIIIILQLLLINLNCNCQNMINVELYITPRNVSYGWADNGVFQFELIKMSVKVPYRNKTYSTLTKKDSVFELFYTNVSMPDSLCKNLKPHSNDTLDIKRIMLVISKKDTMFIDRFYNVIIKEKNYKISSELKEFIEFYMPLEIKENWLLDLQGRWEGIR